ncbi:rhamnogalacturonan acetylesterase [Roseateles violae]|uniref:Rhamnogalacturonan acetylesterase n=1 Tax=Roseateles violae TaxID=3058042 RepID=A0ABT8DSJ2_9BURK|nr:rhamnogalacturonan acetylesterase [Pelomonas sp. PFR6]MDN3921290.1 rhamnogalacturonan acetylesterase [Pelomonas sp. PFR6]
MKFRLASALSAALLAPSLALADVKPARMILVGDSTMATKSGYGDALCARLKPELSCVNLARGGRSSGSFRAEGLWDQVQQMLRDGMHEHNYVLIQFGHNDQPGKPGRSTDLVHDFPANMARYVDETRAAGATPVLLTPLTRRSFRGPWLHDDLAPWSAVTRQVARDKKVMLIDLNRLSQQAVETMGEAEADTLAMAPKPLPGQPVHPATTAERAGAANPVFDRTHLGLKGAQLFSGIVADEWRRQQPAIAARIFKMASE